jgi:ketosteroid isomerase-like protein
MEPKPVEVIRGLYEATDHRDWTRVTASFDDDVVLVVAPDVSTESGTFRGREDVIGWFRRWFGAFALDYQLRVEDMRDLGDRFLVVQRHEGRGRTSGVPVEMRNVSLIWVGAGKVERIEIHGDLDEPLEANGPPEEDVHRGA